MGTGRSGRESSCSRPFRRVALGVTSGGSSEDIARARATHAHSAKLWKRTRIMFRREVRIRAWRYLRVHQRFDMLIRIFCARDAL